MLNPSDSPLWQFWIDVGGTFTDCIGRAPDGSIHTTKILSSGTLRGTAEPGSSTQMIVNPALRKFPDGFFLGYSLDLLKLHDRKRGGESRVMDGGITIAASYDGAVVLSRKLKLKPRREMVYELKSPEEAPVVCIRKLMGIGIQDEAGPLLLRLGTTRGTNALLERKGARTAFVTTGGFTDLLEIGTQNRPRLFDLDIRKPKQLYSAVAAVRERVAADGTVLQRLDLEAAHAEFKRLQAEGVEALAICLLHGYKYPAHERALLDLARQMNFRQVSISSEVAPAQRIVPRAETTVLDAYLTPVIRDYVAAIQASLPQADIRLMNSAGGLQRPDTFTGKDCVLSGPAGGVVGCANAGLAAGFETVIGLDMGGTSADVSRYDGRHELIYESSVRDEATDTAVRVTAPMLRIETVAAGGGSVCWFDGRMPRVGPHSAGADPGPACYGRNGPLTVTDLNLFLGRLLPDNFSMPLDADAPRRALEALQKEIADAGQFYTLEALAEGFLHIANRNMSQAIRAISLSRGYDPRSYAMVSFGGAASQHACAIARELGMKKIVMHPLAGLLSAWGLGLADVRKFAEEPVGLPLNEDSLAALQRSFESMLMKLRVELREEGIADDDLQPPLRRLDLRYRGQDWPIAVDVEDDTDIRAAFEAAHEELYGFTLGDRPVEIVCARMELRGRLADPASMAKLERFSDRPLRAGMQVQCYMNGDWRNANVYYRGQLGPTHHIDGPAIVLDETSTILIEDGWHGKINKRGVLVLDDRGKDAPPPQVGKDLDAIQLRLFQSGFTAIAEEMGLTLQRTAISTNVKERLDFSCALFTADGELVVNAPHIPVHLGAMADCVQHILAAFPDLRAGDCFVTNDPFAGGSHLPDVTVVTPVFDETGAKLLFFTASRAHHAEIGGIAPGSMPPFAASLAEEGVLIRPMRVLAAGESREQELEALLRDAPHPSRAVHDNLTDIRAQIAANRRGAQGLLGLVKQYGQPTVAAYMRHVQDAAADLTSKALRNFEPGRYEFKDTMDDGSPLCVRIDIAHTGDGARAVFDFAGSGPVVAGNLNANPSIVKSAVLYCLRCLMKEDLPLNAGMLRPVDIRIPEHCLLNPPVNEDPARCAAVGGGNVETSQRLVDIILGALGAAAASQGTMNNVLFGMSAEEAQTAGLDDRYPNGFGYYETLAGGAGAGPGFDGADAVHTHMTNTRLTDPEVLEARYPVRLRQFKIRRNSGGTGLHKGGDGLLREIEFLAPMHVSLVTSRRASAPFGLQGGGDAQPGRNQLTPPNAPAQPLPAAFDTPVEPGTILKIETPGGGGHGESKQ